MPPATLSCYCCVPSSRSQPFPLHARPSCMTVINKVSRAFTHYPRNVPGRQHHSMSQVSSKTNNKSQLCVATEKFSHHIHYMRYIMSRPISVHKRQPRKPPRYSWLQHGCNSRDTAFSLLTLEHVDIDRAWNLTLTRTLPRLRPRASHWCVPAVAARILQC